MNKIYSLLGLANKAGKVVSGEDAVRDGIRHGKIKLTILAEDASKNTSKRFANSAAYYHIPLIVWGQKELLGHFLGKVERTVIGVTDEGFCNALIKKINEAENRRSEEENNPGGEPHE